jgi:lysophospholipase L1-like esterase/MoaA/NifB/PqqE/SkfB family radical SAM enzyme
VENLCKIVCFGDSITKGYHKNFKDIITRKYSDHVVEVIDAGAVGETTNEAIKRLDEIINLKPTVAIVGFGMNDWRKGVDKTIFKNNLEKIIDKLQENGSRIILLTINPNHNNKGKISKQLKEYNEAIRNIAYSKRIRIADVYSLWLKEIPKIKDGLYDDIHPNRLGNKIINEALIRVVTRSKTVVVWQFNGEHAFCPYECEYCYVASDINKGYYFQGDIRDWHIAFKNTFGSEKLIFYLSFGEPMAAKNFYDVLDMIAKEPNWEGHMTSNLCMPLDKLVKHRLVKEGRFHINASFHPTQTSSDRFLKKLLLLREYGIECPVIFVMWPPLLKDFERYFEVFNKHNFLIHVRRFRGWYDGKFYPRAYTDAQRKFIAKYCDDATIKYMLNDLELDNGLKRKLSYQGMFYVLVNEKGDIWTSPDSKDKCLGNIFKENVRLFTEPQPYGETWNGSVNGIASFLEFDLHELEGNFVLSFAKQGGVYHTGNSVYYKNMYTNFNDTKILRDFNFPLATNSSIGGVFYTVDKLLRNRSYISAREYLFRKIYPTLSKLKYKIYGYTRHLIWTFTKII